MNVKQKAKAIQRILERHDEISEQAHREADGWYAPTECYPLIEKDLAWPRYTAVTEAMLRLGTNANEMHAEYARWSSAGEEHLQAWEWPLGLACQSMLAWALDASGSNDRVEA